MSSAHGPSSDWLVVRSLGVYLVVPSCVSNWSGVYGLVDSGQLTSSTGGDFNICKRAQRTRLRILSIALEEELKALGFV